MHRPVPSLIVAKKITPILKRLNQWFSKLEGRLADVPVLLIDDEADQASINTRGNRSDPSIDADTVRMKTCDITNQRTDPRHSQEDSAGHIHRLHGNAIRQHPHRPRRQRQPSRRRPVPKDFVVQLPRPDGYTGTEELFGTSAQDRDVLRPVDPADVKALKPKQRKKEQAIVARGPLDLPQSFAVPF